MRQIDMAPIEPLEIGVPLPLQLALDHRRVVKGGPIGHCDGPRSSLPASYSRQIAFQLTRFGASRRGASGKRVYSSVWRNSTISASFSSSVRSRGSVIILATVARMATMMLIS
jgi:hypothetical protein